MGNEKDTITTVQATESSPPQSVTAHPQVHQERPTWLKAILLVIDVGLALSPLLFLGIAFAAIAYNHKRTLDDPVLSKNITTNLPVKKLSYQFSYTAGGQAVIDVAQIAVSIFPILFAAIVGRFMKSWALHRAERGSTMGVLEQLYGSQNLSNAVQLLFALRGPGLLGIAVVFVWLLSPLGGQGVKRVLGTKSANSNSTATVYYCNTSSAESRFSAGLTYGVSHRPMNDALASLLFTDSVSQESDVWGNVKIPYLDPDSKNASGWAPVSGNVKYSAMTGLLIDNLPNETVTFFDITTSYVNMVCQDARTFDYSPPDGSQSFDENGNQINQQSNMTGYQEFLDWAGSLLYYYNMTNTTNTTDTLSLGDALAYDGWQYFLDARVQVNTTDGLATWAQPPSFVFATQEVGVSAGGNRIYAYECASSMQYLEASLECNAGYSSPCSVTHTRPAKQPTSQYGHPLFQQPTIDDQKRPVLTTVLDFLNSYSSLKQSQLNYNAPQPVINRYLAGAGTYASQINQIVAWSNVTGNDLSPNLGTILNTAWLIGVQGLSLVQPKINNATILQGSDPTSPTYYFTDISGDGNGVVYIGYDVTAAPAIASMVFQIYQVSWTWVIIAIVISLLLLFLGLLGLYFRHTNSHPDVLGFVSTLTRDNPAFEPPPQAEKLDGMEMANYYKHTRVQLVNTAHSDEQARITLRQVQRSSGDM